MIKGFVACKSCKQVYIYQPCDGTQSLRKHNCHVSLSGPLAQSKPAAVAASKTSFNWVAAGFNKATGDVPRATKGELNRAAVTMCALDFRPLSTITGVGFQCLAQSLVRIGSKYGDVDISKLFHHPSTYSRRLLRKWRRTYERQYQLCYSSSLRRCLSSWPLQRLLATMDRQVSSD